MYDHALIDRTLLEIARARTAAPPGLSPGERMLRLFRPSLRLAAALRFRTQRVPG